MKVELISYTQDPVYVGGTATRCCTSEEIPVVPIQVYEVEKNHRAFHHAMDSGHHSVAEHITFTFAIEGISRACSHQLVRHRMASYSQQSQRYVKMDGFDYVIPDSIRNHRARRFIDAECECDCRYENWSYSGYYKDLMREINSLYRRMVEKGIPEEDARYILPNACCTNIVMTVNLRELIHIAELRLCTRAQWEIRELVEKMVECVVKLDEGYAQWLVPQCQRLGYCPEKRGCGKVAKR